MDNGIVTFFDVNAFGFYRLKKQAEELDYKFGDLSSVFADFQSWLNGKNIEETIPWDVGVHPMRSKTYCRGVSIDPDTGDIVIVLLRAVGDGSGNLHGVRMGSAVGADAYDTVKANSDVEGEEIIWGEPCYYWIIPEHNKIASIIFPHSGADTIRFCNYITSFVNNNANIPGQRKQTVTSHADHRQPGRVINTVKTRFEHGAGKEKCNCIFKFNVEQTKIRTAIDNLTGLIPEITETIIRDTTTTRIPDERGPLLQLASEYLPSLFGEHPEFQAPKRIEVKIDGAPSAEDIARLFEDRVDETDWADIGFKIKGSDIPVWLTKYVVKSTLAIDSDGFSHYSSDRVLNEIKAVRDDIISSILNQQEILEAEQLEDQENAEEVVDVEVNQVAGGGV